MSTRSGASSSLGTSADLEQKTEQTFSKMATLSSTPVQPPVAGGVRAAGGRGMCKSQAGCGCCCCCCLLLILPLLQLIPTLLQNNTLFAMASLQRALLAMALHATEIGNRNNIEFSFYIWGCILLSMQPGPLLLLFALLMLLLLLLLLLPKHHNVCLTPGPTVFSLSVVSGARQWEQQQQPAADGQQPASQLIAACCAAQCCCCCRMFQVPFLASGGCLLPRKRPLLMIADAVAALACIALRINFPTVFLCVPRQGGVLPRALCSVR